MGGNTLQETNISPKNGILSRWFSKLPVWWGICIHSLEGISNFMSQWFHLSIFCWSWSHPIDGTRSSDPLRNGCDHFGMWKFAGCDLFGISWIHVMWWKKSRCFKMSFQRTKDHIAYPPDIEGGSWMKKLSSFPKWDISDRFVGFLSYQIWEHQNFHQLTVAGCCRRLLMWRQTTGGTWTTGHLQQALILGVPWAVANSLVFSVGKGGYLDGPKKVSNQKMVGWKW